LAVLDSVPIAYWRFEEMVWPFASNASSLNSEAEFEPGVALYLPGPGSGNGVSPQPRLTPSNFSGPNRINRAIHLAGGRVSARLRGMDEDYSIEFWFWNGLPNDARPVTGTLFWRGFGTPDLPRGEFLAIGGTTSATAAGRLIFAGDASNEPWLTGSTPIEPKRWHHVVLVRTKQGATLYLNGQREDARDFQSPLPPERSALWLGGHHNGTSSFEGKLDEVAVYARALTAEEIRKHFDAAAIRK